jgi:hypothetical protein
MLKVSHIFVIECWNKRTIHKLEIYLTWLDLSLLWVCMFICLFWVARAIFQLSGDCHHYRWQSCKFRPTAFSSEGSFTCHTYCDTGLPFLRLYPKDQWFSLLNAVLLAKEQSLPILNVLGLTRPARAGSNSRPSVCQARALPLGYSNRSLLWRGYRIDVIFCAKKVVSITYSFKFCWSIE